MGHLRYFLSGMVGALVVLIAVTTFQVLRPAEVRCQSRAGEPLAVLGGRDDTGTQESIIDGWQGPDGMRAKFVALPESTDLERSEMVATARSGACAADIYVLDTPWIPGAAEAGYIQPVGIPEDDLKAVLPEILATGDYDGRLWAVPLKSDAPLLFYRKDLVRTVPRNWNELKTQAQALVNAPGSTLTSGYILQLGSYEGFAVNVLELIRTHGGDISVSEDGKVRLSRAAVLTTLNELAAAMKGPRPLIDQTALEADENAGREAFKQGKVPFMRNWPSSYALIANSGDMDTGKLGVVAFPGSRVLGGQSLVIAASLPSERVRAARALIRYLVSEEQQQRMFACGGFVPVRADVYDSDPNIDCGQGLRNKNVILHAPATAIRQAIENARRRPAIAHYPEFSRVLQTGLHQRLECMIGRITCVPSGDKEFLDQLTDRLQAAAEGR